MLVALDTEETRSPARYAEREAPYHCPECLTDVILKRGKVKVPHFAHRPGDETCPNAGESIRHLFLKERLFGLLSRQSDGAEVEWPMPGLRADILATFKEQVVAFEVQVSTVALEELQDKLKRYTDLKVPCMYIIDGDLIRTNAEGEYRCPKWIRALHALNFGRVYAFSPSCNAIGQVHFRRAERWVEDAYNSEGDEVGGYSKTLRTVKIPVYGPPVDLQSLRIVTTASSKYQPFPGRYLLAQSATAPFWHKEE
jgi:competence protein CoiA